jgi:hypothetical protein
LTDVQYIRAPDGRVGRVYQRSGFDCFRMSVRRAYGNAYGLSYGDIPAAAPGSEEAGAEWDEWAAELGLRWWQSTELAPVFLPRWIASVEGKNSGPDECHAVAMQRDQLLWDPNEEDELFQYPTPEERERCVYLEIRPADLVAACALIPREQAGLSGSAWWRIRSEAAPTEREDTR